jgi:hypothetical protein
VRFDYARRVAKILPADRWASSRENAASRDATARRWAPRVRRERHGVGDLVIVGERHLCTRRSALQRLQRRQLSTGSRDSQRLH